MNKGTRTAIIIAIVVILAASAVTVVTMSDEDGPGVWPIEPTGKTYSIEYVLDGGTMEGNPTEYTSGSSVDLTSPVKEGYVFAGWYLDPEHKEYFEGITPDTSGNLTLYAAWNTTLEGHGFTLSVNGQVNDGLLNSYTIQGMPLFLEYRLGIPRNLMTLSGESLFSIAVRWYWVLPGTEIYSTWGQLEAKSSAVGAGFGISVGYLIANWKSFNIYGDIGYSSIKVESDKKYSDIAPDGPEKKAKWNIGGLTMQVRVSFGLWNEPEPVEEDDDADDDSTNTATPPATSMATSAATPPASEPEQTAKEKAPEE